MSIDENASNIWKEYLLQDGFSILKLKTEGSKKETFTATQIRSLIGGTKVYNFLLFKPAYYAHRILFRDASKCYSKLTISQMERQSNPDAEHLPEVILSGTYSSHSKPRANLPMSRRNPLICKMRSGDTIFEIAFFFGYESFYIKLLKASDTVFIVGQANTNRGSVSFVHPEIYTSEPETFYPIYPLKIGVSRAQIADYIKRLLAKMPNIASDYLDYKTYSIPHIGSALKNLHNAASPQDFKFACKRFAFEESLMNQISRAKLKASLIGKNPILENKSNEDLSGLIPYALTGDQSRCLERIYEMQKAEFENILLVQGDVGSGKTVVALFAMLNAVYDGRQALIIAPTYILASQHYNTLIEYCEKLGVEVVLITGRDTKSIRRKKEDGVARGKYQIIIGTHALFYSIEFYNLGCVVVDEQHRFGVNQRITLLEKSRKHFNDASDMFGQDKPTKLQQDRKGCDMILMSATPIPRTLHIALYGGIKSFSIKEKPPGRQYIDTFIMGESKIEEMMQKTASICAEGGKVYWVCPLVEESEKLDCISAEERYKSFTEIMNEEKIGIAHGRMTEKKREDVLLEFLHGKINLLVCTTVIEVGVNVPDATIMVIENANRFGLSALHQLRGRVGRGDQKSYCFLIYSKKLTNEGRARLGIMKETNDGFEISQKDMEIRGSGSMFGIQQSGFDGFTFFDPTEDEIIAEITSRLADRLVSGNSKDFELLESIYSNNTKLPA